jgi:hypothetical protein
MIDEERTVSSDDAESVPEAQETLIDFDIVEPCVTPFTVDSESKTIVCEASDVYEPKGILPDGIAKERLR